MLKSVSFFREVRQMIHQVSWPDRRTLVRLTAVVILVTVCVGMLLSGTDIALTRLLSLVVK